MKAQDWLLRCSMHFNTRWGYSLDEASSRAKMLLQSRGGKTSETPEENVDDYMNGVHDSSLENPVLYESLESDRYPQSRRVEENDSEDSVVPQNAGAYEHVSTSDIPVLTDPVYESEGAANKAARRRKKNNKRDNGTQTRQGYKDNNVPPILARYNRMPEEQKRYLLIASIFLVGFLLILLLWPEERGDIDTGIPGVASSSLAKSSSTVVGKGDKAAPSTTTVGEGSAEKQLKIAIGPKPKANSNVKQNKAKQASGVRYSFFLKNGRIFSTPDLKVAKKRYQAEFGREFKGL